MATRFRLPSTGTAAVSPVFQTYTHTSTTRRPLPVTDASALTTVAVTPDAADHLVAGDVAVAQFVSEPLAAQTIAAQVVTFNIQGLMAHANNALNVQLWIGVVSNTGTALATLLAKTPDATVLLASLASRTMAPTTTAYTITAGNEGARIVVELSLTGTPTATGGIQGHNGSLRFGGNGAGGDLTSTDGQTGTTLNPWCEFANTLVFLRTGTLTRTLDDLTETMLGTAPALPASGTLAKTLDGLTEVMLAAAEARGTSARTLDDLTESMLGTVVYPPVSGTLSQTLDGITEVMLGAAEARSAGASILADATCSAAGTVAFTSVSGAVALTLGALGHVIHGAVSVGDVETTNHWDDPAPIAWDAATYFWDETGPPPIRCTLARTLDSATLVAAASAPVLGVLDEVLLSVVLTASSFVSTSGASVRTLDPLTVVSHATNPIVGTVARTLDSVGLQTASQIPITGTAARTLDPLIVLASSSVPIVGTTARTLADVSLVIVASAPALGTTSRTLDALTVLAQGLAQETGRVTVTLADATCVAAVSSTITGTFSRALAACVATATVTSTISGTLGKTLGDATLLCLVRVEVLGHSTLALDAATLAATGIARSAGTLTRTLDECVGRATAESTISATLGRILDDAACVSTGEIITVSLGVLVQTLDDLGLDAEGIVQAGFTLCPVLIGVAAGVTLTLVSVQGRPSPPTTAPLIRIQRVYARAAPTRVDRTPETDVTLVNA